VIAETKEATLQVVTPDNTPLDNTNAETNSDDDIVVLEVDLEDADMKELSGETNKPTSPVASSPGDGK
jgi:hypothetical protein